MLARQVVQCQGVISANSLLPANSPQLGCPPCLPVRSAPWIPAPPSPPPPSLMALPPLPEEELPTVPSPSPAHALPDQWLPPAAHSPAPAPEELPTAPSPSTANAQPDQWLSPAAPNPAPAPAPAVDIQGGPQAAESFAPARAPFPEPEPIMIPAIPSPTPGVVEADGGGGVRLFTTTDGSTNIPAGCYQESCAELNMAGLMQHALQDKMRLLLRGWPHRTHPCLQLRYIGGCIPCPWSWSTWDPVGWCLGWGWSLVDEAGNKLRHGATSVVCLSLLLTERQPVL